jgi:membrane-associated phospholipid phosphatase
VERLDLKLARAAALREGSGAERVASGIAGVGDQPPLILACAVTIAAGAAGRDARLARTGLRMLAAHAFSVMGKLMGKGVIDRTRPDDAIKRGRYKLEEGGSKSGDLRSMPSGHSAGTVAVAVAAGIDYPRARMPLAVAAAAIVGGQVPSRNHFLSDTLVGSLIGLGAAGLAAWLIPADRKIRRARP